MRSCVFKLTTLLHNDGQGDPDIPMSTRRVMVDDTSQDVNYIGGSWFADIGSQDSAGNFGPPFLSTLHGTNSSASLSLSFSGR